ncbi:MAG: hypothetical protein ACRET4_08565 [Steroidobacteraceae bacterium]
MDNLKSLSILAAALGIAWLGGALAGEDSDYSNKWRIECSGRAQGEGDIHFRVTPKEGEETEVDVAISQGRSENDVAHDIRDAFQSQLSPQRYHVESDDGEDVLIKVKEGTPDFSLVLVESTVEHVRLHLQRE